MQVNIPEISEDVWHSKSPFVLVLVLRYPVSAIL